MVVQHNLTAMNSNRQLGLTTSAQAKSTEKLSSGYKINRAADDAAGLSISEKMRKQIRGLTQASSNAQDGISAVQTAEGALTEVHDMLQRMNELAVKASNGTMSEDDRSYVQNEIDQLVSEIDRVSETTKFNETYLLKGNGKDANTADISGVIGGTVQAGTVTEAKGNIFSGTIDADTATALAAGTEDTATITYKDAEGNQRTKDITFTAGTIVNGKAIATAESLAKAINDDEDLGKLFNASVDSTGKLSVESILDGTKTDNTKNAVTAISFASATPTTTGGTAATRLTKFNAAGVTSAATGASYELDITDLADGESITIDGKTYTYDAAKNADSAANSFSNIKDLETLLGTDYSVSAEWSANKKSEEYAVDNTITATTNSTVTADLDDTDIFTTATKPTAAGEAWENTTHTVDTADTADTFTGLKLSLTITKNADIKAENENVLNLSFQVGADTTKENKISVDIESMNARNLGIDGLKVDGEDSTNADAAVDTIAAAIKQVSTQRSALGAVQNRLEHTINNLDNVVENTTSAESAIRDTDMATEMVKYSNNNILTQAGQAMLAQANQSNQGVLSLLQ